MSKHALILVLFASILYSCTDEKKPAGAGVVQAQDTAILADTGWNAKESKQIKDSLLDKWLDIDGLELNMAEYNEIWNDITKKDFNPRGMVSYLKKRENKYLGADMYFVLTQVSAYFYLKEAYKNKKFAMDEKTNNAVGNVEQNMQYWYPEKIIWECVDDGQPLKDHYVLLENGKARTYFSYLLCTMNQGTWKQKDSTIWIKFGKNETVYTENDTMFVNKGQGRNLYKIPVTYPHN
ncbi:MAG TPA: hypothetical protein VD905_03700 [Flavobacteriales bacterium]|nr:hypothetical protein [Flavobacteriales bacterium]